MLERWRPSSAIARFAEDCPACAPCTPLPPSPPPSALACAPTAVAPAEASALAAAAREHARELSTQCGQTFADAMPDGSVYGGHYGSPPLLPLAHGTCPDVEASLALAERAPQPHAARDFDDRLADGAISLPAGCALRWFSPREACAALPGLILAIGDSLSRHLLFGLVQIASGNYATGLLAGFVAPPDSPAEGLLFPKEDEGGWHRDCTCEWAYSGMYCSRISMPKDAKHFAVRARARALR